MLPPHTLQNLPNSKFNSTIHCTQCIQYQPNFEEQSGRKGVAIVPAIAIEGTGGAPGGTQQGAAPLRLLAGKHRCGHVVSRAAH